MEEKLALEIKEGRVNIVFWEKLMLEIKEGRVNIENARCPSCKNKVFVPMIGWQKSANATPENPLMVCGDMGHWWGMYSECDIIDPTDNPIPIPDDKVKIIKLALKEINQLRTDLNKLQKRLLDENIMEGEI